MTTDPQGQRPAEGADADATTSPKKPWLLALVLILAGVAAVGGVTGIVLYDRATGVDRSDPTVTVEQFLTAVFVEKDVARIALFTCPNLAPETAAARARGAIDVEATASWGLVVLDRQDGNHAQVSVRIRAFYPGELAPSGQQDWVFQLVDASGWRVCSFEWDA